MLPLYTRNSCSPVLGTAELKRVEVAAGAVEAAVPSTPRQQTAVTRREIEELTEAVEQGAGGPGIGARRFTGTTMIA